MTAPRVRPLPQPGEPWLVEFDRTNGEILLNTAQLPGGDQQARIVGAGAALVAFAAANPAASDEELTTVALSAA
jgi:hypothetical protein